ncbi:MAG: extracellular solute-binding protein [Deltaproteobacteria bacterium]|nr:extracellular solute-binding protein [Deltaproteobacteria bacterium]
MRKEPKLFLSSLLAILLCALLSPSSARPQGAAQILKRYEGLKGKEREEKLIEGAKKEGSAVVYSFTAVDQLKPLLDEFHKKYSFIKPEHFRANATTVFNKFTTEVRAGQTLADVIDISAGESHTLLQMGLIDPYLSPNREGIPKDFMDEKGYWTAHYHFVIALGYNTQAIKPAEAPKSYEEIINLKWKGRLSLDPADQDLFGALLLHWGKEKAIAYFKNLAKLEPRMVTGHTQQANLVGSGEIQLAPWLYGYRPLQLKDQGAPVEVHLFDPVLTNPAYLLFAKNSRHPHAAALFIDWALSAEGGMKFFGEKFGRTPTRPGLKERFPKLRVDKYLVVKPEIVGPNFKEFTKLYYEIFGIGK